MRDKKKYYKELYDNSLDEEQRDKKLRKFLEDREKLKASNPDKMDRSFFEKDSHKVSNAEVTMAKNKALMDARKQMKGKPLEEAGDVLDYAKMKKQMGKIGRRGLKAIPLVGALASLASPEDAAAAVPVFGDIEGAGMSPEEEDMMIAESQARKNYSKSQARIDAINNLRKKARGE